MGTKTSPQCLISLQRHSSVAASETYAKGPEEYLRTPQDIGFHSCSELFGRAYVTDH